MINMDGFRVRGPGYRDGSAGIRVQKTLRGALPEVLALAI
jgi:hypothetical protein